MIRWLRTVRLPILTRLLLANGLVIVLGASIGTTLTKALVEQSAFALAVIFTACGVLLSLLLNYFVLRVALRPLSSLTDTVDQVREGEFLPRTAELVASDPDIERLADSLNSMLERLARHTDTIEANREQLRALSAQVITAQEEERKRIARELHDDTSQSIASLLIALERIDSAIPEEMQELKNRLGSARDLAGETLDGLRVLVADLRPLLLDDLGLLPAMRWYARRNLESQGIDVELLLPAEMPRLSPPVETALFRISQEAINNVIKHADASHVRITLTCEGGVSLRVEDDGTGFSIDKSAGIQSENFGLFGIQERAATLGGSVEVRSIVGAGTCLRVMLPLEEATNCA